MEVQSFERRLFFFFFLFSERISLRKKGRLKTPLDRSNSDFISITFVCTFRLLFSLLDHRTNRLIYSNEIKYCLSIDTG